MNQDWHSSDEFDRLLYRWCDGSIAADEGLRLDALLADDPAVRQYFLDYVQLDAQLRWELAREEGDGPVAGDTPSEAVFERGQSPAGRRSAWSPRGKLGKRWLVAGGLSAAVAATVVVGFLLLSARSGPEQPPLRESPPVVAHVRAADGVVDIIGPDGTSRPAAVGEPMRAGDSIRTALEDASASVQYEGVAEIELGPDTLLQFAQCPDDNVVHAAHLIHVRGTLELEVGKRPVGRPLILSTPQGEIRVLGTRFRSLVGAEATRVEIEEGRVEVTRSSDQRKVAVGEGDYLLMGADHGPLSVRAAPIILSDASRVLEDPESREAVRALAFTRDGRSLLTGGFKGAMQLWDVETGAIRRLAPGHKDHVRCMALSPDGRTFFSGGEDNRVLFWNAETGQREEQAIVRPYYASHAVFCEGGDLVATAGRLREQAVIRLWQVGTGKHVADVALDLGRIACLAASPDGLTVVAGDSDGNVAVADIRQRRQQAGFHAHEDSVLSMALSPDGRWLATGGRDAAVKLWDAAGWQLRAVLKGHTAYVVAAAFCPDRTLLATSDNHGMTRLWDVRTGEEAVVISWPGYREARTVFTPDGHAVVTAGTRGIIKFWDVPEEVRQSSAPWKVK